MKRKLIILTMLVLTAGLIGLSHITQAQSIPYPIVDTGQANCYDANGAQFGCPAPGAPVYGQDAQYTGNLPSYTDNGDGTVTDNVTGLTWQQSPDTDGDGAIDVADKRTYSQAGDYCQNLTLAGHADWRLPDIKQLYSLIDFGRLDPSGYNGSDTSGLVPFIDTGYFDFAYGDTAAGERIIDAQFASSTLYVATTMNGAETMFGLNLADGRIKGYPTGPVPGQSEGKTFYLLCVRGKIGYGVNNLVDNGDGTITDHATGLMWAQHDAGTNLNWQDALAWVEQKNDEGYLGYGDWRLPNAKELQSIVDYTRSPDTTGTAAIDPLFNASPITNEADQLDYAAYWSSTTHLNMVNGANAAYVAFGRAMGCMNGEWIDVHGAGAQRSDPKSGDPADWPTGHGPQGDAIRIYNAVRLVRDAEAASATPTPADKVYLPLVMSRQTTLVSTPTASPTLVATPTVVTDPIGYSLFTSLGETTTDLIDGGGKTAICSRTAACCTPATP
jgi:hypothetical protein